MLSTVTTPTETSKDSSGVIVPLVSVAAIGIGLWKGFAWLQDYQSRKATEEAQKNILKHDLSIKRTHERIAEIERKAYVTGVNSNKKTVTVNIINQTQEIINGFFVVLTDKNGIKKYILKAEKNISASQIRNAIFNTPIKSIGLLQKVYNIYTGRNLLNDCQKLPPNTYTEIKTIFAFAQKKYGK